MVPGAWLRGSAAEDLREVNIAVFVERDADADLGIGAAEDVAPMAGR